MNPSRRSFLRAAVVLAPAVILTPGLLMPVRDLWKPKVNTIVFPNQEIIDLLERTNEMLGGMVWAETNPGTDSIFYHRFVRRTGLPTAVWRILAQ